MAQEGMLPMHDKPRGAEDEGATTPADEDLRDQAAVLRHILSLYPQSLTELELLKEMTGGMEATFADRDRHRRAVRDLTAGGLLGREGERVLPSRAALLFYELEEA
jgi:hypothetical protein